MMMRYRAMNLPTIVKYPFLKRLSTVESKFEFEYNGATQATFYMQTTNDVWIFINGIQVYE
jgi:hypothetical protein